MISAYVFFLGSPIFSSVDSGVESGVDSGVPLTFESLQGKNFGKCTNTFLFLFSNNDGYLRLSE